MKIFRSLSRTPSSFNSKGFRLFSTDRGNLSKFKDAAETSVGSDADSSPFEDDSMYARESKELLLKFRNIWVRGELNNGDSRI